MEARGPADYDRDTDEHIARVVLQTMQAFPYSYKSHNGNGLFVKWLLTITSLLIVTGLAADIAMGYSYGQRLSVVEVQLAWLMRQK